MSRVRRQTSVSDTKSECGTPEGQESATAMLTRRRMSRAHAEPDQLEIKRALEAGLRSAARRARRTNRHVVSATTERLPANDDHIRCDRPQYAFAFDERMRLVVASLQRLRVEVGSAPRYLVRRLFGAA